jgi:predicted glycoside hydrolase/deacetylase ChbG (UPF0249 family)
VSHPLFSDVLFVARKSPQAHARRVAPAAHRVILTADDWGMSPAVNRGILKLVSQRLIDRVSILVDAPFAEEGLEELVRHSGIQIGLHFNLTYQTFYRSPLHVLSQFLIPGIDTDSFRETVRIEFRRQVQRLLQIAGRVDHIDGHHHIHIFPGVAETIAPLAVEKGIFDLRLPWDRFSLSPKKWFLKRLSQRAQIRFDENGIYSRPCFYPDLNLFKNPDRLWEQLQEKPGHEIILHPAEANDFEQFKIEDPYRDQRVIEFQGLLSAGQSGNFT